MKVAAYQAPLASCRTDKALALVRTQIEHCESLGVEILCCPEGMVGGLADYLERPADIAIDLEGGGFQPTTRLLASDSVTTILGFTEVDRSGRLFNSAAIVSRGAVVGRYRKRYPAINRSVYRAGSETPVFTVGQLTFGVVICRDSSFPELSAVMVSRGATTLFVPTNNGMPPSKGSAELVAGARAIDVATAIEHGVCVVRADVAGRTSELVSHGSSGIVDKDGNILGVARQLQADLVVAEIDVDGRSNKVLQPSPADETMSRHR
jgi:predicted amidohydrolase